MILLYKMFLPSTGPNQLPIQSAMGGSFPGIKRLEREAENAPPSATEVYIACRYIFTQVYNFMTRNGTLTFPLKVHNPEFDNKRECTLELKHTTSVS